MSSGHDLRIRTTAVKDQGRRGTCVACAATAAHELLRAEGLALSIEFLHWAAKQRDGMPHLEGTVLAAADEALAQDGQPDETFWPYDDARDQWAVDYGPSQVAMNDSRQRRLNGGVLWPPTATNVRAALNDGWPVVLGLRLYATWHSVGADGRVAMPAPGVLPFGGHAVVVVGYRGSDLIVQNSWGSDWGDGGFGYLPDAYVDQYGIAAWSAKQ